MNFKKIITISFITILLSQYVMGSSLVVGSIYFDGEEVKSPKKVSIQKSDFKIVKKVDFTKKSILKKKKNIKKRKSYTKNNLQKYIRRLLKKKVDFIRFEGRDRESLILAKKLNTFSIRQLKSFKKYKVLVARNKSIFYQDTNKLFIKYNLSKKQIINYVSSLKKGKKNKIVKKVKKQNKKVKRVKKQNKRIKQFVTKTSKPSAKRNKSYFARKLNFISRSLKGEKKLYKELTKFSHQELTDNNLHKYYIIPTSNGKIRLNNKTLTIDVSATKSEIINVLTSNR